MTTLAQFTLPDSGTLEVPDVYYRRHLGLPAHAELEDRLVDLTDQSRQWYHDNATPWTTARYIAIEKIEGDVIYLEQGVKLTSPTLAKGLASVDAHALVVVGVTAGEVVEQEISRRWKEDRPDEAMFLNSYAIAAVEHLRWTRGDHLRQTFHEQEMTVLPHYSPGYEGWDLSDQNTLFALLKEGGSPISEKGKEFPIDILESGCLIPTKSTLAAYGITRRMDLGKLDDFWLFHPTGPNQKLADQPSYAYPKRTLVRWKEKRLTLLAQADGKLEATFQADGSTCTNMGTPLIFVFRVSLQKKGDDYEITEVSCTPAENHKGYQSMCAYLSNPDRFMTNLDEYRPLVGKPLSDALTWDASISPAGCLCTRPSQDHKWRIVFQTIHFALQEA